jgi:vitamin B12 transporter
VRWWRNAVTVGIDHQSNDIAQTQPRLTTPDDTLLLVADRDEVKTSIGFNSSLQGEVAPHVSGSFTVGVDHWRYQLNDWYAFGALTTVGTIQTAPGQPVTATRAITHNTGYYAQAQIGFFDALFLTAGVRAEQNSEFGDSLGTPVSPRVGASYVHPLGRATLKVRGSWGRAIRAPSTGAKLGWVTATGAQIANPELGPERQQGWDAGVDVTFGDRGSLGITYYNQLATNLADAVVLQVAPLYTQQFQNVGRVKNTGVEIEGALDVGPLTLRAQYGYTRARIEQLAPGYPGPLQVGDQMQLRPRHTAGGSLAVMPTARTTVSAGVAYLGSWLSTDIVAQFRCYAGTEPCRATQRDYLVRYPAIAKLNASVVQQLSPVLAAFASIDNVTNNDAFEGANLTPVVGRTSTLGLRLQY